jgi:hypothetical protein
MSSGRDYDYVTIVDHVECVSRSDSGTVAPRSRQGDVACPIGSWASDLSRFAGGQGSSYIIRNVRNPRRLIVGESPNLVSPRVHLGLVFQTLGFK